MFPTSWKTDYAQKGSAYQKMHIQETYKMPCWIRTVVHLVEHLPRRREGYVEEGLGPPFISAAINCQAVSRSQENAASVGLPILLRKKHGPRCVICGQVKEIKW